MFVSKKKYEALKAEHEQLVNVAQYLDDELNLEGEELEATERKLETLVNAVEDILSSETAAMNGTTKRIMRELNEALESVGVRQEKATFVDADPAPELGTLADIARSIKSTGKPQPVGNGYVHAVVPDVDTTYLYNTNDAASYSCSGGSDSGFSGGCD